MSVFPLLKARTRKAKASFQQLLLYLQYIVWNRGAEIPRTWINNTNKTMLPDELSSFGSIVTAARYKHCRVLHILFTSQFFVFVAWSPPKLITCLQQCAFRFLHSLIQPSLHIRLTFSGGKKKGYIWDKHVHKKGMYKQHIEADIKHYTHTVQCAKTLWCLKLEWLFMQTEALAVQVTGRYCRLEMKWKTNPNAILNKTLLGSGLLH